LGKGNIFLYGFFSWKGRATPEKNWKIYNRLADELLSNDIAFRRQHPCPFHFHLSGQVSYCHHLASVVVVRLKLFQKSSPLKVLDQWKPNLVWIITRVSSFKMVSGDAVHQPTWPLLLKIEHMVKLKVSGNNSKTVNNIKNLTWSKNDQHSKIYIPCNFEVNYTLYKNAGFWLVNSRDIFYKFRPSTVNLQNFYIMCCMCICTKFNFFSWYLQNRICRFYPLRNCNKIC
jgi:hypothetical protein